MAGVAAVATLATGLVALTPSAPAQALSGNDFHAGYIITDYAFYNGNAMSQAQIQSFLNSKIGTCGNTSCLTVLKMDTPTKAISTSRDNPSIVYCNAYTGAKAESAAAIIFKVQKACGISAKAILVTLQKEVGLITNAAPASWRLERAMGFGCPDHTGGTCSSLYYGFFNQVYAAARQLKIYKAWPDYFNFRPGVRTIAYNPDAKVGTMVCGSSAVTIANYATAGLYNYTPYQPNAAALRNLSGTGDACSSYGNRNFWVYYNNWFGSPTTLALAGVSIGRIGGADRYATAVAISKAAYKDVAPVVYVTTGQNYPDALSAAPAAAKQGGPLLLVKSTEIPAAVATEIKRLKPALIVAVGGTGAISDKIVKQLGTLAPSVRRDGGSDRYETSRIVVDRAFGKDGSKLAYVATGANYPDALAASAAAGAQAAPVVLVPGNEKDITAPTAALLTKLAVTNVKIAGGSAVVSASIATALTKVAGVTGVQRLFGADRYLTAVAINRDAFETSNRMFFASGSTYPDALAGAAVAGAQKAPLYVIPPTCAPIPILEDITTMETKSIVLLGGTGALSNSVKGVPCR
jgi:putative cell wall-binding protein